MEQNAFMAAHSYSVVGLRCFVCLVVLAPLCSLDAHCYWKPMTEIVTYVSRLWLNLLLTSVIDLL